MTGADDLSEFEKRQDRADLYRQRPHTLAPEVEFEAGPDALSWTDAKGNSGSIAYDDIAALRLSYDPSRMQCPRHILDVETRSGGRVRITSTTYRGMASWRSRAAAFVGFLEVLHARLSARNRNVAYHIGRGVMGMLAYGSVWGIGTLAMAYGVVLALRAQQWAFAGMLGLMAGYFAWLLWLYVRNNWPRTYTPERLPRELLPTPSDSDV